MLRGLLDNLQIQPTAIPGQYMYMQVIFRIDQSKMKLIQLIMRFFRKHKKRPDPIAEAIAEGIKEAFKEM